MLTSSCVCPLPMHDHIILCVMTVYANYCWLSSTGKGVVVVVTVVDAVMLFCLFSAMHFVLKVVAFVEKLCERGSPDSASKSRRSKVASKWSPGCVGKKSMWAYLRMEIRSKLAINPARGVVAPTFPHTSEILVSRIPRGHACRDYPQYSLGARALRQWRRRADPPGCLAGFPPLWRHRSFESVISPLQYALTFRTDIKGCLLNYQRNGTL